MLEEQGGRYNWKNLFKDKDIQEYNKNDVRRKKWIGMVFPKNLHTFSFVYIQEYDLCTYILWNKDKKSTTK